MGMASDKNRKCNYPIRRKISKWGEKESKRSKQKINGENKGIKSVIHNKDTPEEILYPRFVSPRD